MTLLKKQPILIATLVLLTNLFFNPVYAAGGYSAVSLLNDVSKATQITEGTGPKTLYILFDPNCPYCHLLFEELRPYVKQGAVTIHWIVVGILTPTSPGKAAAILQAKSPLKAFYQDEHAWNGNDYPGGGIHAIQDPTEATQLKLEANDQLMTQNGLSGVPVTVFKLTDGTSYFFEGTPPRDKLAEVLKFVK